MLEFCRLRFVLIILIKVSKGKLCFLVINCVLMMIFVLFLVIWVIFFFNVCVELKRFDDRIVNCVFGKCVCVFFVSCFISGFIGVSLFLIL